MQEALNKGNYKLNAIIDKLLAQTKLPKNLTLGEYYMLLNKPRSPTSQTQNINQKMQKQLKNATMKSLYINYFNNKDIFILKQPLLTISIPSSINNYKSENIAQRNYPSNNKPTFTSNKKKSKWHYKKDTPS